MRPGGLAGNLSFFLLRHARSVPGPFRCPLGYCLRPIREKPNFRAFASKKSINSPSVGLAVRFAATSSTWLNTLFPILAHPVRCYSDRAMITSYNRIAAP